MSRHEFDSSGPVEQAHGLLLAYPQHHFTIQRQLRERYTGDELVAEERCHMLWTRIRGELAKGLYGIRKLGHDAASRRRKRRPC